MVGNILEHLVVERLVVESSIIELFLYLDLGPLLLLGFVLLRSRQHYFLSSEQLLRIFLFVVLLVLLFGLPCQSAPTI